MSGKKLLNRVVKSPPSPLSSPPFGGRGKGEGGARRIVAIAADHRGFKLKEKIIRFLKAKRIQLLDCGTDSPEPCDYPDFILKAAEAVRRKKAGRAIGICYTGVGSAICANKVKGVRAALVHNVRQAELSRAHNDSNMLILGAGFVKPAQVKKIIDTWLKTQFEGGRHARRVGKIIQYERRKDD